MINKIVLIIICLVPHIAFASDDSDRLNNAQDLLMSNQTKEAFEIIKPIAEKGNTEAQIMLGNYYIINEKNTEEGRKWLLEAAESGDSYAQLNMAGSYLGRGTPQENKEGIRWLLKSANQGNTTAAEQLSLGYSKGWWGLPKNIEKAKLWKKRARGR